MRCDAQTQGSNPRMSAGVRCSVLATALLAGCAEPVQPAGGMSEESLAAARAYASQYEPLRIQSQLPAERFCRIERTGCRLIVPPGWTQTARTWFERDGSAAGGAMPQTIKVIEHATVDGSLEGAIERFTRTAQAMTENYNEQHRWSLEMDGLPAVAVQYEHTEESSFPGKVAVTRAYFTVKADRFVKGGLRLVVISCTAPRESFDSVSALFDEVAGRVDFVDAGR